MAKFCETLAETGMVVDACLAAGKNRAGAYALRHRDPLFAAAWEAALGLARVQLSDALLARSIEGSVERFYRDGALVGEKRYFDNRLGLAVLKRLDRVAETGSALPYLSNPHSTHARHPAVRATSLPVHPERSRGTPHLDWVQMVGALRTGDPDAMAVALAALRACPEPGRRAAENPEVDKTDTPPDSLISADGEDPEDPSNSVWENQEAWWTDFPPPAGFGGVEHGQWGSRDYRRTCTPDEEALMVAATTLEQSGKRAAQEADRTAYFAEVAAEIAAAAEAPGDEAGRSLQTMRSASPR
ncbi:MAG: hypothetical protein ABIW03_04100 [Sphingomicrobium sp.]